MEKDKETKATEEREGSQVNQNVVDFGSAMTKTAHGTVYTLAIIGQIEGHTAALNGTKTTQYEHMLPLLAKLEESREVDGILFLLNTVGGDVEAGLAIAELIAGLTKPTAAIVLGGSHSIGVPLAVAAQRSFAKLKLIAKMAKQLNVQPNIGIRIKLASSGSGKWEESGGDASKFGLTSSELLEALDFMESKGLKDCLKLIHFHIGSQVTKIRRIKTALREASQFYVQLHAMGFKVEFVDIGGGLGVDYDGTRSSNSEGSVNYSIQEYVNDSISTLVDVSDKNGIPHPNIITESGRALTAHHSVLIFEVLETATLPEWDDEEVIAPDAHELVQELYGIWDSLNQNKMLEAWHDAQQIREEALDLFSHGIVDLKTRAQIERLYWSITREINQIAEGLKHAPDEFRGLSKLLADKYFCNFSLFQSLPDSWAIDQIFPIMPIQRLDEKPDRSATLQDITCDSDGKIANFISTRNVAHYLPVHSLKKTEPYYVAVFLVGAYQEILGDMHNLFGDTNAVHVSVNEKGYNIEQIIDGETVAEVLDYVQYNPKKLVRTLETWVTKSVKEGKISLEEGKEFLSNYRSGLYGYTYLE